MQDEVIVLMSTYNGQEYIVEQIESIFNQTFEGKITVLIRDDGSSDGTKSIVLSIKDTDNRKIIFYEGNNCGPQKSFLNLIKTAQRADYYFFADQDDVWDIDKIEIAVHAMKEEESACVYCSNYRLSDMDLKVYNERAIKQSPKFTPLKVLFYNQIPGCTMGFNYKLMSLIKKIEIENVMMHDSMVLSFAAYCGKIIYDENPRITHRIHAENVVGDGHKKIHLFPWLKEKFNLLKHKENYDVSEMARQFELVAGDAVNSDYSDDIKLLRDYKKSRLKTHKLLRHKDSKDKAFDRTTLSIRSKIFFHLF